MKLSTVLVAIVIFFASAVHAQNTASQTPPPGAQDTQQDRHPHHGMGDMHGMSEMHQQHMNEMKANLDKMHALLKDMRTKTEGLNQKEKAAMMDNVQLWQMMVDHLDSMMKHMQEMQGSMGEGHMMHHQDTMHSHGSMEEPCCDEPAPTQPPKSTAPPQ